MTLPTLWMRNLPAVSVVDVLPLAQSTVSQHLKVLKEAGLVTDRAEGTRRVYYLDPKGLAALRAWLDQFWDQALAAFQEEAEKPLDKDKPK